MRSSYDNTSPVTVDAPSLPPPLQSTSTPSYLPQEIAQMLTVPYFPIVATPSPSCPSHVQQRHLQWKLQLQRLHQRQQDEEDDAEKSVGHEKPEQPLERVLVEHRCDTPPSGLNKFFQHSTGIALCNMKEWPYCPIKRAVERRRKAAMMYDSFEQGQEAGQGTSEAENKRARRDSLPDLLDSSESSGSFLSTFE